MKVEFLAVGKTSMNYLNEGIELYTKRIKNYFPFKYKELPVSKSNDLIAHEKRIILQHISKNDHLILLDEKGQDFTSAGFSVFLQHLFNTISQRIVFLAGGSYGFHEDIIARANSRISLSTLTFPHDLVRLFFLEQLYRACTIMKNEPYHH